MSARIVPITQVLSLIDERRERAIRVEAFAVDRSRLLSSEITSAWNLKPLSEEQQKGDERIRRARERLDEAGLTRTEAWRLIWERERARRARATQDRFNLRRLWRRIRRKERS